VGANEQAAALLARDPAAHAVLDHPLGVADLLDSLRHVGADEQAAALAAWAAAHTPLDHPLGVARLLDSLREAGADEQAARLPGAGMFVLFLRENGRVDQFRFGLEADGTAAAPWGWEDLDLCLVLVRGDMLHRRRAERDAHVGRHVARQPAHGRQQPKPKR
jgi:hypothetical protein